MDRRPRPPSASGRAPAGAGRRRRAVLRSAVDAAFLAHQSGFAGAGHMSAGTLYHIKHETEYLYADNVVHSHQLLHLVPRPTPYQQCLEHTLQITPAPQLPARRNRRLRQSGHARGVPEPAPRTDRDDRHAGRGASRARPFPPMTPTPGSGSPPTSPTRSLAAARQPRTSAASGTNPRTCASSAPSPISAPTASPPGRPVLELRERPDAHAAS